ncbi:ABC transporter substrate-binding protein [Corynebacterium belfantii]|uniref:ABC transporter substrate-binding protein n=1 Tax=Corynebacterium belfantii TaxID=2014537 RepID=UPI0018D37E89|nr:ABC transporter substrate-binding protein [Corynebacterium belfantii]MBG9327002.1 ABC transporter substrate-binding protein [Corynebacterium belfantii]
MRLSRKITVVALSIAVTGMTLTACGNSSDSAGSSSTTQGAALTITDVAGRTVEFDKQPEGDADVLLDTFNLTLPQPCDNARYSYH